MNYSVPWFFVYNLIWNCVSNEFNPLYNLFNLFEQVVQSDVIINVWNVYINLQKRLYWRIFKSQHLLQVFLHFFHTLFFVHFPFFFNLRHFFIFPLSLQAMVVERSTIFWKITRWATKNSSPLFVKFIESGLIRTFIFPF